MKELLALRVRFSFWFSVVFTAWQAWAQAPVVSTFSPTEGMPLVTTVTIEGTNLKSTTTVEFNGTPAHDFQASSDPSGSVTVLYAHAPTNATTGPITVQTPAGSSTTSGSFTVLPIVPPVVASFSPTDALPGDRVTVTGDNLFEISSVLFNGAPASFLMLGILGQGKALSAVVPTDATTGPITVNGIFGSCTTTAPFTVDDCGVTGTIGFSPQSGWAGRLITISALTANGAISDRLKCVTEVRFNGVSTSFRYEAILFALTASVPTNTTTGPITLVTPAGDFTSTNNFLVSEPELPVVLALGPSIGPPGTVIDVSLQGSGSTQISAIRFGEADAPFKISWSAGENYHLAVTVPQDAPTGPMTVITPFGRFTTDQSFTVIQPAILTGFAPEQGPPGTVVRLLGTNLDQVIGVRLGGVPVPISRGAEVTFTVPTLASSGFITIQTSVLEKTLRRIFTVSRALDLGLTAESYVTNAFIPTVVESIVRVVNYGPVPLSDIVVSNWVLRADDFITEPLPYRQEGFTNSSSGASGIAVLSTTPTQGALASADQVLVWQVGTLAGGEAASLQLLVRLEQRGVLYHLAQGSAGEPDPDFRNNVAGTATLVVDSVRLRMEATDFGIDVLWPDSTNRFSLQSSDRLDGGWQPLSTLPTTALGWKRVRLPASGRQRFLILSPEN